MNRGRIPVFLLGMLMCIICGGCYISGEGREYNATESTLNDPILIFCTQNSELIIKNFEKAYPEIEIEVKTKSGQETFEDMIEKYGNPDILLGGLSQKLIKKYYANDIIADMSELYLNDATYNHNDYFANVSSVGKLGENMIAMPISCQIPYMTISEHNWIESDFSTLLEAYSIQDVFSVMNWELDKAGSRENYLVFGKEYVNIAGWLYRIGAIQDDELIMDLDCFNSFYNMQRKIYINTLNNPTIVEQFHMPFAPSILGDTYLAVSYGSFSTPQTGLVLENSIQYEQEGEEIKAIWYPSFLNNCEFYAEVDCFGLIGAKSERKNEAYDIIRKMMDMPISVWFVSNWAHLDGNSCPVNIQQAKTLIETVELTGTEQFIQYINNREEVYNVSKRKLNVELREELESVLDHILVYDIDDELYLSINECVNVYIESNSPDYEGCYWDLVELIDKYYHE